MPRKPYGTASGWWRSREVRPRSLPSCRAATVRPRENGSASWSVAATRLPLPSIARGVLSCALLSGDCGGIEPGCYLPPKQRQRHVPVLKDPVVKRTDVERLPQTGLGSLARALDLHPAEHVCRCLARVDDVPVHLG